jgi:formylaminopyrimidine deformylase / aminopyrimidine aminohydrolase
MQVIAKAKAEEKKIGMTETWLRKHRPIYDAATRHPFILSIRDGTVQSHSFKTWLVSNFQYISLFSFY